MDASSLSSGDLGAAPLKIEKLVFDGLPRYLAEEERWLIVDDVVRLLRLNGGSYWMDGHFNLYVCEGVHAKRPVLVLDDPQTTGGR